MTTKSVLVTGVSSGIGAAICKLLLEQGYTIHGTYNTNKAGTEELKRDYPDNFRLFAVDFSVRNQTLKFIEQMQELELYAIVNNAGMIDFEDFEDFDYQIWDKTLEVNLTTPLMVSQKLSKNLREGGAVINIASTDGTTGTFSSLSYAASKAALINLTKGLGNNLGLMGKRAVAVAPGWVDTEMSTVESEEAAQLTPLSRNGKPEEIADLVSFLITDKASFINGACIIIDGGYTNVDYIMMQEAKSQV